ncbi:hypothetical protein, partial [Escherichia coli]|uniref:hypothetical protein n=1 Tax=Escherichia coli TaxID=562 RepID=UPI00159BB812
PTFLFAQLLLWFAPYFDDIFYVRNRISYDALSRDVSHVSVRPGLFVALGQLDVSSFLDETWHAPTDSITNRARIDHLLGGAVTYNVWSNLGSLD